MAHKPSNPWQCILSTLRSLQATKIISYLLAQDTDPSQGTIQHFLWKPYFVVIWLTATFSRILWHIFLRALMEKPDISILSQVLQAVHCPLTVTDLKKKKIASFVWLLHMGGVQPEKYMMFNVTCHQERSIMGRYNCVRIQL